MEWSPPDKSFYFILNKIHNGVKIEFDQWTHQSETSSQIERRYLFPSSSFLSLLNENALYHIFIE